MARPLALAVVVGVLLALTACGGDSDAPASGAAPEPRRLQDLERRTVDKATRTQLEKFAAIRIPASATGVRSSSRSAMDTQLLVSFRLPAAALDAFVASGDFKGRLTEGDRAVVSSLGAEIGWRLASAKRVEGLSDNRGGLARNLLVVLDDPQRPMVHLEAVR